MQTKSNDFFYSVGGLMVPRGNVDDSIIDYIELLIDQAPILTEQTKRYLNEGKPIAFIMNMKTISSILREIYAQGLMTEANKLIKLAESNDLIVCKKRITPFITDLLSLSIDLQVAQKNSGLLGKQSIIELYTDILNNLKAVDTLISDKENDKAIDLISRIELLRDNKTARLLIKLLKDGDNQNAANVADALRNEYTVLLGDLGITLGEDSSKKRILAVDDHSDILITVKGMLEKHCNVYAAAGGKTALAIMEKHPPDLFLLDIEMPDISGFELAKTIRASNLHKNTPIIFLTSNATKEYVKKAMQCGVDDFIVKPANYNTLIVKISKLIGIGTE